MSSVLDAWSRRLLGWSVAGHLRTELVTDALEAAVGQRGGHRHIDRVVFHSDQAPRTRRGRSPVERSTPASCHRSDRSATATTVRRMVGSAGGSDSCDHRPLCAFALICRPGPCRRSFLCAGWPEGSDRIGACRCSDRPVTVLSAHPTSWRATREETAVTTSHRRRATEGHRRCRHHKHIHVAVAIDQHGARLGDLTVSADTGGYTQLEQWARPRSDRPVRHEGTGSYGAGLTSFLRCGHRVVECNRRIGELAANGKSDTVDAEPPPAPCSGTRRSSPRPATESAETIRQVKIARDTARKGRTTRSSRGRRS